MDGAKSPSMSPALYVNGEMVVNNMTKEELDWMDAHEGGDHYICVEYQGTLVDEKGTINQRMKERIQNWLRSRVNVIISINKGTNKKAVSEKIKGEFGVELPLVYAFTENMIEFWSYRAVNPK